MIAAFVLLFSLVMAAEYAIFRRAFEAVGLLRQAGPPLTLYLLESFFVLVLIILLVSFVAAGLWIFYRAEDTRLLLAAPVPLRSLYALRAVQTFVQTAWALGVLGLPALLALGHAYAGSAAFYATGAAALLLFATLAGGAGALLTTVAGMAMRRARARLAIGGAVAVLLVGFAVVVGRHVIPSTADFYAIFEPGILNGKPSSIKFIEAKFAWWPSHPFAAYLYTAATAGPAGSAATRAILFLAPLACLLAAATVGTALYVRTLPVVAEGFAFAGRRPAGARAGAPRFPRLFRGPAGAVVERDLLLIARSPSELGRAGFLAFLLVLYTSFILVAPLREAGDRPDAVARLLLLNVLAAGYFLTAFGLRFVFPSTSLEGRAGWVFFSSPIRLFRVFLAKLALHATLLTAAVVPIALLGTVRLLRDPAVVGIAAVVLGLVAVTTTTVTSAFGTAWPDFRESNPEFLTTSGGGLGATVVCLVYVAAAGYLTRRATQAALVGDDPLGWLGTAVALSGLLVAASLALARRRVRTLETV